MLTVLLFFCSIVEEFQRRKADWTTRVARSTSPWTTQTPTAGACYVLYWNL